MAKYLLLTLVVMVVLWGLSSRAARRGRPPQARRPASPRAANGSAEEMVPCAHCGIHLPRREALAGPAPSTPTSDHAARPDPHCYYCCAEHRQRGPAARTTA